MDGNQVTLLKEELPEEWKDGYAEGFSDAFSCGHAKGDRERLQSCILEILMERFGDPALACAPAIAMENNEFYLQSLFTLSLRAFSLHTFQTQLKEHDTTTQITGGEL